MPRTPLIEEAGGRPVARAARSRGLALVAEGDAGDVGDAGENFVPPLHRGQRDRIRGGVASAGAADDAIHGPQSVGRNHVCERIWPTFAWEQEIALGRDMAVRTESKGFLYPWVHPGLVPLTDLTLRRPTPDAGPVTAGLQQLRVLVVPDPVRHRAEDGELARGLPFDEVEILQPTTDVGKDEVPERFMRAPKRLQQLDADVREREREMQLEQNEAVKALWPDLVNANVDAAAGPPNARLGEIGPRIEQLAEIDRVFQEWAAAHPEPPVDTSSAHAH